MVRRCASDAGIDTAPGCHTFRANGITDYLTNGGRIESHSGCRGTPPRKQNASMIAARLSAKNNCGVTLDVGFLFLGVFPCLRWSLAPRKIWAISTPRRAFR